MFQLALRLFGVVRAWRCEACAARTGVGFRVPLLSVSGQGLGLSVQGTRIT